MALKTLLLLTSITNNDFIQQIPEVFDGYDFVICTLHLNDEAMLKDRVLDETRSSEYRDWEKAVEINRLLKSRQSFTNETFIDVSSQSADFIADQIVASLSSRPAS